MHMTKIENSKNFTLLSTEYTAFVCTFVQSVRTANAERSSEGKNLRKKCKTQDCTRSTHTCTQKQKKHLLIAAKVCVTARHRDC